MVNAPYGLKPQRFTLLVRLREIVEHVIREGDMVEACRLGILGAQARESNDGDAVMFLVEAEECQLLIFMGDGGPQEFLPEVDHRFKVRRASNHVCQRPWGLYLCVDAVAPCSCGGAVSIPSHCE